MRSPRALVFVYGPPLGAPVGRGHHLARCFADRLPVVYLPYRSPVELLTGDRTSRRWDPLADHPRVRHLDMPPTTFLARRYEAAARLHGRLGAARVRSALARLKVPPDEALFFVELAVGSQVVRAFPSAQVVYDCADDLRHWHRNSRRMCLHYARHEEWLARRASHVVLSSPRLRTRFADCGAEILDTPNGMDEGFLARPARVPADLAALPRPWLVFVGMLSSYVEPEWLRALGDSRLGSVILVGPRDPRAPVAHVGPIPRVHWLGRRAYEDLPAYVHAADVALIPATGAAASDCLPSKLLMYCAAGVPVAARRCTSLEPFRGCIRLAETPESFVDAVRGALQAPEQGREERLALARRHTWRKLSDALLDRILTR